MLTSKVPKSSEIFFCDVCDYKTSRKSQYERHFLTRKHKMLTNVDTLELKSSENLFECICGKSYKHRQSLSVHKKKCIMLNENQHDKRCHEEEDNISHGAIMKLVNENNDIKSLLIEQQKQIVEQQKQIGELIPKVGNTINNNTDVKQNFNINIFLNEQCKDALNIEDFIKQIKMNLNNLEITKNKGLTEGISNIFIENMNRLSLYERPLHCTDTKRETLYIKENDAWEKDTNKSKLKAAIKNISDNHFKLIQEWVNENPDFKENEEKQNYFVRLLKECGSNDENIDTKIIKKICSSSYLKNEIKDLDEKLQ